MKGTPKTKEKTAKIVRYASFGIKQKEIASKLRVSEQYVAKVLKAKRERTPALAQVLHQAARMSHGIFNNKREMVEELLGFPVTDWSDKQVDEEFFRLVELPEE